MNALWKLFEQADAAVRTLGLFAIGLGGVAVILAVYFGLRYGSDLRLLRYLTDSDAPDLSDIGNGTVAQTLRTLRIAGQYSTVLTPDAVWEAGRDRMHEALEQRQAALRFLVYAPLLIGLSGTILGLSGLLPKLDEAIQRGQAGLSGETGQTALRPLLQGVFAATLGGIIGSLFAAFAGVSVSAVARRVAVRFEEYLQTVVLPKIPERRIAVSIEEAVLDTISTRTEYVVNTFRDRLEPVAAQLSDTAVSAAKAASEASGAFALAASAVKEAGRLDDAARFLANALKHVAATSTRLERSAQLTEQLHDKLGGLAIRALEATDTLAKASQDLAERHAGTAGRFSETVDRLTQQATRAAESFEGLAKDVKSRNELQDAELKRSRDLVNAFSGIIEQVHKSVSAFSQETSEIRKQLEKFAESSSRAVSAELSAKVDKLCVQLSSHLDQMRAGLSQATGDVKAAGQQLRMDAESARAELPELIKRLGDLQAAVKSYVEQLVALRQQLVSSGHGASPLPLGEGPLKESIDRLDRTLRTQTEVFRVSVRDVQEAVTKAVRHREVLARVTM